MYKFLSLQDENGITTVTIEKDGQQFVGVSKLHPDDIERKSAIVGGRLAEKRAALKLLKYEYCKLKEETKFYCNFVKACEQYKNWDKNSTIAKIVYRQLSRRKKKLKAAKNAIDLAEKNIKRDIISRDVILSKRNKKQESK